MYTWYLSPQNRTGHLDSTTSDIQNLNIRELEKLLLFNANEDLQFQNSKMIKCKLKMKKRRERERGNQKFFLSSPFVFLWGIKLTDFSRDILSILTQMERRQFQFESHHRNETFRNSILIKVSLHRHSGQIEVHYNKKRSFSKQLLWIYTSTLLGNRFLLCGFFGLGPLCKCSVY